MLYFEFENLLSYDALAWLLSWIKRVDKGLIVSEQDIAMCDQFAVEKFWSNKQLVVMVVLPLRD